MQPLNLLLTEVFYY